MSMLILLLCTISFAIHAEALECGLNKNLQDENVKNILQRCIANWTVSPSVVEKPTEESTNSTTEATPSSTTDLSNKNLTNTANSTEKKLSKRDSAQQEFQNVELKSDENSNSNSNKCAAFCILQNLELLNGQGYPDRNRIAEALAKNADDKELRDFFQDSTDECFQLQNQDKGEICQYTNTLLSCLSEKGRLNCGDWSFYSLSFA